MSEKVIAVIPCYREAVYIGDVVRASLPYVDSVVVTDDNSDDETVAIATQAGARVIVPVFRSSHGVGSNTWCGIWYALCLGADIIVTLDGDGQHDPNDIPVLVQAIHDGADMVIGSRFIGDIRPMPAPNKLANQILTKLSNIGVPKQQQVTDSQSGFRAFRKEVFKDIRTSEDRFGFVVEIIVKARKIGLTVVERPIKCIYHANFAENSSMNGWERGIRLVIRTARWRLWEKCGI